MFNYYKFEDQKKALRDEIKVEKELKRIKSQHDIKRDEMATKYNHRLQKFIVDVSLNSH